MTTKSKITFSLILLTFIFVCCTPTIVLAEDNGSKLLDKTKIDKQNQAFTKEAGLKKQDLSVTIAYIIRAALAMLGVIFIVLVIYAGILWMTSSGNDEQIGKAKKIMTSALIGFIICISAYAITIFVTSQIFTSTNGSKPLELKLKDGYELNDQDKIRRVD